MSSLHLQEGNLQLRRGSLCNLLPLGHSLTSFLQMQVGNRHFLLGSRRKVLPFLHTLTSSLHPVGHFGNLHRLSGSRFCLVPLGQILMRSAQTHFPRFTLGLAKCFLRDFTETFNVFLPFIQILANFVAHFPSLAPCARYFSRSELGILLVAPSTQMYTLESFARVDVTDDSSTTPVAHASRSVATRRSKEAFMTEQKFSAYR